MGLTLPVEPPPTGWALPERDQLAALPVEPGLQMDDWGGDQGPDDLVARGADLAPGTLLAAYRAGMFPMPVARRGQPTWWSPVRRAVLRPESLRVSRSLRSSVARFTVTVDQSFDAVVRACARTSRPGAWITAELEAAYGRLHRLGWAHSIETRTRDGQLVGGLYGVGIGGLFAGESMFHDPVAGRDASKVALVALSALLTGAGPGRLIDVQWLTPHLASLGAVGIPRRDYLAALPGLLELDLPSDWRS